MQGEMRILDPRSVIVELRLSMALNEWEQLNKQLEATYPSLRLKNMINDLFVQLTNKVFKKSME